MLYPVSVSNFAVRAIVVHVYTPQRKICRVIARNGKRTLYIVANRYVPLY